MECSHTQDLLVDVASTGINGGPQHKCLTSLHCKQLVSIHHSQCIFSAEAKAMVLAHMIRDETQADASWFLAFFKTLRSSLVYRNPEECIESLCRFMFQRVVQRGEDPIVMICHRNKVVVLRLSFSFSF